MYIETLLHRVTAYNANVCYYIPLPLSLELTGMIMKKQVLATSKSNLFLNTRSSAGFFYLKDKSRKINN